jgi:hypothetical protein
MLIFYSIIPSRKKKKKNKDVWQWVHVHGIHWSCHDPRPEQQFITMVNGLLDAHL